MGLKTSVILALLLGCSVWSSMCDGGYEHGKSDDYDGKSDYYDGKDSYKDGYKPPYHQQPYPYYQSPPYYYTSPPPPMEECPPPPSPPECPPPPPKFPPPTPEYSPPPPPPPPPKFPPPPPECPPPPPLPPKYPPPPPKVDCSKCFCNCEACPIYPPSRPCPDCNLRCPEPPTCDPVLKCPKCECPSLKCPEPPKCDPVLKCPPCPKCELPECPKCELPECPKCELPECPKCRECPNTKYKYDVESISEADVEMVNNLLDVEYVLQGFYKNAAAGTFKDVTVKRIAADFSSQTSDHISAIKELLKTKASEKPQLNLSKGLFANVMSAATGAKVEGFDTFATGDNVLLGASLTAPLASSLSTGMLSKLQGREAHELVASLSSGLAAQNAAVNVLLLERASDSIAKGVTVGDLSADVSKFQQKLNTLTAGASNNLTAFETSAVQLSGSGVVAGSPGQVKAMLKELGIFT